MKTASLKISLSILGTILCAIGLVIVLAWNVIKVNNQKNGFTRNFIGNELKIKATMTNETGIDNLAGSFNDKLYFQTRNPNQIVETDINLKQRKMLELGIPRDKKWERGFSTVINYPYAMVYSGNVPGVLVSKLDAPFGAPVIYKFPLPAFTRSAMISPGSYVVRGVHIDTARMILNQFFYRYNAYSNVLSKENKVSDVTNDAGMSSDGTLLYDTSTHLLIYTNLYRNKFLCMDTGLNLLYTGNTIDTISTFQIAPEAGSVSKNTTMYTTTKPKRAINWRSCVADGLLYINSKIRADNEEGGDFKYNSVIDIYNIKTGTYLGSFYVGEYEGEKMNAFTIIKNTFVAIYKNQIVLYDIPFKVPLH